jgi:hypothetical protein
MEHRRSKLALFFVAQALGVAAMIALLRREPACGLADCERASATSLMLTTLVILGELWILAHALRADGTVWRTVLALGILALIAAPLVVLFSKATAVSKKVVDVAVVWHLAGGLLLLVTGAAGGVGDLLARLRRSDDGAAGDRGSAAMWPLD